MAAAAGDPGRAVVWVERGKEREGGGEGPAAQDIGLVAPARMARQACRASACGATGRATSSPSRHSAGSGRPRGHTVAPHALARQRLSVAPCGLARQDQCPRPTAAPSPPPSLSFPPPPRPELQPGRRRRPPPPQIGFFLGEKVRGIVPYPSPKVLPLISHRLTMCISSYWWFFY